MSYLLQSQDIVISITHFLDDIDACNLLKITGKYKHKYNLKGRT